jgi:RNA polymerase sigma-70 factor (ECF subfamily)
MQRVLADSVLVDSYASGEGTAVMSPGGFGPRTASEFTDWVRPHWSAMDGLASRLCAPSDRDDAVQEALSAAWRKRGQFDPSRGTARNWLLAITADQCRKSRRGIHPSVELLDVSAVEDVVPDLDLRRELAALPPRQRLSIALHYYLQMPVIEIAEVMACAEGTVKSTLSAARANLKKALGDRDE